MQNNNMGADCTLVADKMYIRILTNDLTDRWSKRMSYKDVLKQYYDGITGIINLTDEILKLI